jgi:hypothetical protein
MSSHQERRLSPLIWSETILDQLRMHWSRQLRPRLNGLTDEEYFWEPVPDCWSIRPRGQSATQMQIGSGDFTIDFAVPEPEPAPVTTIAWRLGHLIVGVLGARISNHFGGPRVDYFSFSYAGTAAEALDQLDGMYEAWTPHVAALDPSDLERPCGPSEGAISELPMAALLLHINREIIHHGAEIALLRDLYLRRSVLGRTT